MQLLQIWPMLGVSQNFYRQQRPAYLAKESTCNLAKALGKLGYIVCRNICDSRCFLRCFHVCPPVETLLRKQNLLPGKQKCFLSNSETFDVSLCFSLMFPSVCPLLETWRNIGRKQCFRNNVS
jgi:hypothetical protein